MLLSNFKIDKSVRNFEKCPFPKGTNRQQGTLQCAGTLDAYLVARKKPLTERSHGAESVSSPSLSNNKEEGSPQLASARQVKAQPHRKGAQERKGYILCGAENY